MTKTQKQQTYDRGLWAENLATLYLMSKGYRILERRYKTKAGEIDLIAKKKDAFVFIEVKSRKTKTQALESLTPRMRGRIQNAALYYCAEKNLADVEMRFDLIAVIPPFQIEHLDNAWQAEA